MNKIKVGVIGSGMIGTDLMMKLHRSKILEMSVMIGIDRESKGLMRAKSYGHHVIPYGIDGYLDRPYLADILFDATSAAAHKNHFTALNKMDKTIVDLTPSGLSPLVVPIVNLKDYVEGNAVSMISSGGQATIPIMSAIKNVCSIDFAESVCLISNVSTKLETLTDFDEYVQTTEKGMELVGGAKKAVSKLILNSGDPPVLMRDTLHCYLSSIPPQPQKIVKNIREQVKLVAKYVPGYRLRAEPIVDGRMVIVDLEIKALGEYLPEYAGQVEIMTAAAVRVGEELVKVKKKKSIQPNETSLK